MTYWDASIPDDLHLFTEDWVEAQTVPAGPAAGHRCALVLLSDQSGQDAVRQRLTADDPGLTVVFAARGAAFQRLAPDRYEIGGDLTRACRELLRTVAEEHGPVDIVAHLWGTEDDGRDLLRDPDPLRALLSALAQDMAEYGRVPSRVLFGGAFTDDAQRSAIEAWPGFERSIGLVLPGVALFVLCLDATTGPVRGLPDLLAAELSAAQPATSLHTEGRRYLQRVSPATLQPPAGTDPLREGGTYLITGGVGGLGTIFASWLARTYRARLVLLGRRPEDDPGVGDRLAALRSAGAQDTLYCQADVADPDALTASLRAAVARFGRIDGVLHAAGVEQHGGIADRDAATFARVLEPKVSGTLNLEQALTTVCAEQVPDFVCYFSSSAAVLGDFGSCDYAVGNRFQVAYARQRARLHPGGPKRLAINWPLWRSDGMNLADAGAGEFYLRSSGQRYLEPAEGTALFHRLLTQPGAAYLALVGEGARIRAALRVEGEEPVGHQPEPQSEVPAPDVSDAPDGPDTSRELRRELREIVHQILRLPVDKLAADENLREFGFDSITLVEFAGTLSERLEVELTPDVFFSYPTLGTLHEFLLTRHHARLDKRYGVLPAPEPSAPPVLDASAPPAPESSAPPVLDASAPPAPESSAPPLPERAKTPPPAADPPVPPPAPVAAPGEAADAPAPVRRPALRTRRGSASRFRPAQQAPEAEWEAREEAATDPAAPTPAAAEREDHSLPTRPAFAPSSVPPEERYAIIGMSGRFPSARTVDELWDVLVEGRSVIGPVPPERREWWADGKERPFGWAPGIAEFDPLFFEIAPSEAATMDPRQRLLLQEMWGALEDAGCGREQLAAQKVGVFVGAEEGDYRQLAAAEEAITSNHNAVLAARLSYFLNLTGPGIVVNTACSSGLVALHEACLSLRNGDCDAAIVASANLMATPREYDAMTEAGMLSPQGICRAFDRRADGMVPSEAVAVVVLKQLKDAERDGHRVYASILATGINNDGRTNGITAPSGQAQTRLLQEVYERAGISPDSLSHLVTHGTGTRLGDPVEINALTEAFDSHTSRRGFCALTSTKPTVGHSLAASGLVSLIGLVQGMRHEIIPPSIHAEEVSDFVNWSNSPFYVNHEARAWPEENGQPRRAAVSSFGFSGTNAHAVLESHGTARGDLRRVGEQPGAPWHLLVCSARGERALSRQLRGLADHLAALPADVGPGLMASVSHTLLAGRHHFAQRCAVVVRDREDAVAALRRAADGYEGPEAQRGTVPRDFEPDLVRARAVGELVSEAAGGHDRELLVELGRFYCQGYEPTALKGLWGATPPVRIGLPSYPFDNAEYWVTASAPAAGPGATTWLHPLVHRNVSDLTCQRFASTFSGDEEWFATASGGIAPGALLEMARAAVALGLGGAAAAVELYDVRWHEQIAGVGEGGGSLDLRVDLRDAGEGQVDWAVYVDEGEGEDEGEPYLVCDGGAAPATSPPTSGTDRLDLPALHAQSTHPLVELEPTAETFAGALVLYPGHVEAALTAVRRHLGWSLEEGELTTVRETWFTAGEQSARWALVSLKPESTDGSCVVDVDLAAVDGTVLAHLSDVSLRREPVRPAAIAAQPPGEGRRPRMRGWTVSQCLAWELADAAGRVLSIPAEELDPEENLANYGVDSLNIAKFAAELSTRLRLALTPDLFFSHPTLLRLENHLLTAHAEGMNTLYREGAPATSAPVVEPSERKSVSDRFARGSGRAANQASAPREEPVAIVGMSGRFPDARSVSELWSIISEGRSVIDEVPEERRKWWHRDENAETRETPRLGCVPGIAEFDPLFFEMSPREAELMDPRQRLLLQEMWKALEDAGYGRSTVSDQSVGIFVGAEEGDYRYLVDDEAGLTSNSTSILASRLAYFLNLSGPSLTINTSCSSGLVALHEACLSLRYGDCDTAIVAGTSLMSSGHDWALMERANMLSPDRTCYAFDRRANGMVPGEAVAVLVLKRKDAAERDGNPVHATILGSGVNYDGRTNGITAPSGQAQTRLLTSIYDRHGISPDTLGYVVAHGTGTRLGDPIETNALAEAFRSRTDRSGFCALTSIKPNIGHSMAASGLVNLICLVMAMRKETIPPSLNCEELSDYIEWESSPFFVNREARPWPATRGHARRGGVSSFGMSGTNAHVVLEAYSTDRQDVQQAAAQAAPAHHLLLLSAKTEEALVARLNGLADHLEALTEPEAGAGLLTSVSRTLMTGRHHFAHRCAVVIQDTEDAVRLLREAAAGAKIPNLVRGVVNRDFSPNATISKLIDGLVSVSQKVWHDPVRHSDHLTALAEFYCQGHTPNFEDLWENRPRLVSLPGYPFVAEDYWVPADSASALAVRSGKALHPLVHEHTSEGNVIHRFSSQFSGREAFLNDLLIPIENTTR